MCSTSAGVGRHVFDSFLSSRVCFGLYFFHHRLGRAGFSLGSALLNVLFFQHLLSGCALSPREKTTFATSSPTASKSTATSWKQHFPCQVNNIKASSDSLGVWLWSWWFPRVSHCWLLLSWVLRSPLLFSLGWRGVPLAISVIFSEGTGRGSLL